MTSRDPLANGRAHTAERVLEIGSASGALGNAQATALVAVAALAAVILIPNTANVVRVVMTLCAIALIILLTPRGGARWLAVTIPAALLWNPVWPVYLSRGTWIVLDLVFGAALLGVTVWSGYHRSRLLRELASSEPTRLSI